MHQWASIAAAVVLLANNAAAQNMLRFACSQLVVDRVDPLVNPGVRYTPHLHQIVGGNSFNLTMTPVDYDLASRSSCTSCSFAQDKSNYWTAVMFFKAKNGTYHRVPQVGNGGPQGKLINKGGLDVYYIPSGKVTAFKAVCCQVRRNARETQTLTQSRASACWRATLQTPKTTRFPRETFAIAAGHQLTTTPLWAKLLAAAPILSESLKRLAAR
jgi:hypothetical protein